MLIDALISSENELMHNIGAQQPIVLSTRIRLARNLRGFPFPGWAKPAQCTETQKLCLDAIETLPKFKKAYFYKMDELSAAEKSLLVERHLISKELAGVKEGGAVAISRDQTCSVMVNEEDHLRIQVVRGGFHMKRAWKAADQIDTSLAGKLVPAFSSKLGFLTACPTNVGTGLRASAMVHLPALAISDQMEKVVRALNQDGIAVRGWFGEGSEASGNIFQISNQHTLGAPEETIIGHLNDWLGSVIEQEENARLKLIEDEPHKFFDRVMRCFGTLRHAHLMTSAEAMNMLSIMRLACDVGMCPPEHRVLFDRLFVESQPAHIQAHEGNALDGESRDICRARLCRENFATLPAPEYSPERISIGEAPADDAGEVEGDPGEEPRAE